MTHATIEIAQILGYQMVVKTAPNVFELIDPNGYKTVFCVPYILGVIPEMAHAWEQAQRLKLLPAWETHLDIALRLVLTVPHKFTLIYAPMDENEPIYWQACFIDPLTRVVATYALDTSPITATITAFLALRRPGVTIRDERNEEAK